MVHVLHPRHSTRDIIEAGICGAAEGLWSSLPYAPSYCVYTYLFPGYSAEARPGTYIMSSTRASNREGDWHLFDVYWRECTVDCIGYINDAIYLGTVAEVFDDSNQYGEPRVWLLSAREYGEPRFTGAVYTEVIARLSRYTTLDDWFYATDLYIRTAAGHHGMYNSRGSMYAEFAWYVLADCASPSVWYEARIWIPVGVCMMRPFSVMQ